MAPKRTRSDKGKEPENQQEAAPKRVKTNQGAGTSASTEDVPMEETIPAKPDNPTEIIMQRNTGFAYAVDIWSLGCTVLEMVTRKPPWSEYEGVAAMFKVSRAEIPPIPDSLSVAGKSFIKLCLQRDPADRPTAAALLHHPFVQFPNESLDFKTSDARRRSTHPQNDKSSIGLLRGGIPPLGNSEYMHPGTGPSRSAPVSPRSSYTDRNKFSTVSSVEGFSTPPAHSPRRAGFEKSLNGYSCNQWK